MRLKGLFRARPGWCHPDPLVRKEAVKHLTDQALLAEIAKTDHDKGVRETAVRNLTDQGTLVEVARNDGDGEVRRAAVWKLTNEDLLLEIAQQAEDESLRRTAERRLLQVVEGTQPIDPMSYLKGFRAD
jgi:hypothetical protein